MLYLWSENNQNLKRVKKLIVSLCFVIAAGAAYAQNIVKTSLDFFKYEAVESPDIPDMKFLLDKVYGTVWQYGTNERDMSRWQELFVQEFDDYAKGEDEDQVNYQITIGDPTPQSCYLQNIHTGKRWNFAYDKPLGLYILLIDKSTKTE